jgi:hypothetical protein
MVLAGLLLFGTACARPPLPPAPAPTPAFAALRLHRIVVGPVAYATYQPNEPCSLFIDEEVRSAQVRELRRRGYSAYTVGKSVPRTFANGPPPPAPGVVPIEVESWPAGADGLLLVWVEEYWENTLCGWEGPKYLTIGATAALYAGSPPREVWRGRGRVEGQGMHGARDLIWLTTTRLTDQLLGSLPAVPARLDTH